MAAVMPPPVAVPAGSTHPFTCNTCQVAFRSSDLQRTHMQSDWHRYNLKRRVASLPPLTSEIFAEKVLANKASAAATAARASFEKVCPACTKIYYSENAYQNHLGSQKHKAQVARMRMQEATRDELETGSMMSSTFSLGEPLETASAVSTVDTTDLPAVTDGVRSVRLEDDVATSVNGTTISSAPSSNTVADGPSSQAEDDLLEVRLDQCLFCNIASDDLEGNLNHMQKQHGMFIPEQDFLVDLEGLFSHLHEVIYDLHQCLYCKQVKHTVKGVQTHMRDRGHCMIAYSTEEEMLDIGEYYDFRSTYSDEESEEEDEEESDRQGAGVKLGAKRASKTVIETENGEVDEEMGDADEDGWESDASSLSSVPTDEITAMPIDDHSHRYQTLAQHRHHSHADTRVHRHTDGFHSHAHSTPRAVYHDDYELHLPSGRVAGHRSLNKYYRQNLRNRDEWSEPNRRRLIEAGGDDFEEVSEDEVPTQHSRQRDRGRQLISRAARESALAGISDSKKREIRATEKRTQQKEQRARMKFEWGNERRANHQKHYRDPLLQ